MLQLVRGQGWVLEEARMCSLGAWFQWEGAFRLGGWYSLEWRLRFG